MFSITNRSCQAQQTIVPDSATGPTRLLKPLMAWTGFLPVALARVQECVRLEQKYRASTSGLFRLQLHKHSKVILVPELRRTARDGVVTISVTSLLLPRSLSYLS